MHDDERNIKLTGISQGYSEASAGAVHRQETRTGGRVGEDRPDYHAPTRGHVGAHIAHLAPGIRFNEHLDRDDAPGL
jgi:hypothetical protein